MIHRIAHAVMHWMVQRYKSYNNYNNNLIKLGGFVMRLAVVSSDGENVDLHLGKGRSVYVYDYDEELEFVEMRTVEIAEDSKHQGGKVIKACSDCDVLFSAQYGFKSKIKAENAGIKLVMDEGPIEDVIKRYLDHVEFMKKSIM